MAPAHSKSHFVNSSSSGLHDPQLPIRGVPRKRHPLSDATDWATNQATSSPGVDPTIDDMSAFNPSSDRPSMPHHSSLHPGGLLQAPLSSSPLSRVENNRVSAVSSEEANASNRLSQISQTSTNASGTYGGRGKRKTHVGPWRLGRTIGKGASGRVRKARHATTGQDAAIKIVSKKSAEASRSQSLAFIDARAIQGKRAIPIGIEREVVIMKMIEHPNIIRLYDIWENRGELYLVLEYVEGGELFDYIASSRGLPEDEVVRIFRQIIAALAYCHQFNICHRDLKPENILLDGNGNIKIVDFGMAALQPANKWLETPCGSPHYASPEVIRAEPYRGDKADIWSCGVILYAMLAGFLPFDAQTEDWRHVISAVLECDYKIPEWLSQDAQDLIWRILQPNPNQRMSIKHMWDHPLIKKYAHLDTFSGDDASHVGPPAGLTIQDCGPRIRCQADIDTELLRNLHDLWHGATEDELSQKLLSDEPNHEKIVYSKLLRYREEQLEHYEGPPLEASMSDYHHTTPSGKTVHRSSTHTSLRFSQAHHRQSQYSLADHHVQPMPQQSSANLQRDVSVAETEKTAGSYDPFRSSRSRIVKSQAGPISMNVSRGASRISRGRRSSTSAEKSDLMSPRLPMNPEADDVYSLPSSPPATHRLAAFHNQRRLTSHHSMSRGNSKITIGSARTGMSGSSPFVARKRASYKRTVSFNHNGRRSVGSGQPQLRSRERQPVSKTLQERYIRDQAKGQPLASSRPSSPGPRDTSPMPDIQQFIRSKKEGAKGTVASAVIRASGDKDWNDDVRKISTELNRLCDTAFNRVSVSSSAPTAITPGSGARESQGRNLSSATSFSIYEDPISESGDRLAKMRTKDVSTQANEQPSLQLPPIVDPLAPDRFGSYAQRELAKTRDLLKKRNRASYMEPGYLDDVIAHLDRLMQPSNIRVIDEERRAVTDPSTNGILRKDTFEQIMENGDIGFRSASEPAKEPKKRRDRRSRDQRMIVVEDTSEGYRPLSPIKPLTIRKKSGVSSNTTSPTTPTRPSFLYEKSQVASPSKQSHANVTTGSPVLGGSLERIDEFNNFDPADRSREKDNFKVYKKRSWFRGHPQSKFPRAAEIGPTLPAKDHHQVHDCEPSQEAKRVSATSEESQAFEAKTRTRSGRFFKKIFAGKRDPKIFVGGGGGDYHLNDAASFDTEVSSVYHRQHLQSLRSGNPPLNASSAAVLQWQKSHYYDHKNSSSKSNNTHQQGRDKENAVRSLTSPDPILSITPHLHYDQNHPVPRPIRHRASNWLARFLGIKPATHILCFQATKLRARREIAAVFRDWRRFGMRDVTVDKRKCIVYASVGKDNSLSIPPLSLSAQCHTLLHHGRRANLSIVRLVQERGAKSSFERVVKALEGGLIARGREKGNGSGGGGGAGDYKGGILIEDERVVAEMRRGAGF